jgi:hypothetical protein
MPVIKCSNGKYRIGSGACIFDTEEKAQSVWAAIRVSMVDSYNDYPEAAKANARRALNIKKEKEKVDKVLELTLLSLVADKLKNTVLFPAKVESAKEYLKKVEVKGIAWAQRKLLEIDK